MILEFFGSKIFTIPCYVSLIIWFVCGLLQLEYCLQFSVDNLMKYGAVFFGANGLILMTISMLFNFKTWEHYRNELVRDASWGLERSTLNKKIQLECRVADILLIADFLIIIIAGLFKQIEVEGNGFECLVVAELFEKHFPSLMPVFLLLERVTLFMFASALAISPYYIYFFRTPMKIWLFMLNEDVVRFSENFEKLKGHPNFDSYVKNGLKYFIRRYDHLYRKHKEILRQYFVSFFIFTASIICFILYQVMVFFADNTGVLSVASGALVFMVRLFYFTHEAQMLENEQEKFRCLLCTLNWYEWNLPNQKLFQIFLIQASVELSANMTPLLKIDHNYFKDCVKMLYTVTSLGRTILNR